LGTFTAPTNCCVVKLIQSTIYSIPEGMGDEPAVNTNNYCSLLPLCYFGLW